MFRPAVPRAAFAMCEIGVFVLAFASSSTSSGKCVVSFVSSSSSRGDRRIFSCYRSAAVDGVERKTIRSQKIPGVNA